MSMKLMANDVMKVTDRLTDELDKLFENAKETHSDITMMIEDDMFKATHKYHVVGHYDIVTNKYVFGLQVDDEKVFVFSYREDALKTIFCDVDFTGLITAALAFIAMNEGL